METTAFGKPFFFVCLPFIGSCVYGTYSSRIQYPYVNTAEHIPDLYHWGHLLSGGVVGAYWCFDLLYPFVDYFQVQDNLLFKR